LLIAWRKLGEDSESVALVVLSYNRGPESVRTILRELRNMDNYSRNFWTLLANRNKLGNSISAKEPVMSRLSLRRNYWREPQAFELSIPPLSMLAQKELSPKSKVGIATRP